MSVAIKTSLKDLAFFGGEALFSRPRSTSNLLRPDIEKFLLYSKVFHEEKRYSNNGTVAQQLEQRLAELHGVTFALVFSSGFWAIVLAMKCLGLSGRDEVVMPSLTYRRMADIASWASLKPSYCDVDPTTLAMSVESVESRLTEKTALILGVHPIINCADAAGIEALGLKHGIPVLFDSVESVYETVGGRRVGGFGDAECFSLHACKLINGFGGGYLTTNNPELYEKLRSMRAFGFTERDSIQISGGLNAKLNEMHAALALASLDDLEGQITSNRERYLKYRETLGGLAQVRLVEFDDSEQSGFKNIVVELTDSWPLSREMTLKLLHAENVLAREYYSPPLHVRSSHIPHIAGSLSSTDRLANRFVNLPCGQRVTTEDISRISELLRFIADHGDLIARRISGNV
jgi:dTDP-4-amino-4,6-dideoxygalactose transaminase